MYIFYINILGMLQLHIHKFPLVMRLITIIMLTTILHVSAASFAQKITYIQKDATLIQLFKEIKKQTGYNVFWSEEKLDVNRVIGASFKDSPLGEVMESSLSGLPFTYVINKRTIVIKEKPNSFLDRILDHFTNIDVRGTVYDDQDMPLAGATVRVKSGSLSVVTDYNGKFHLKDVEEGAYLVISYLGYETKEVKTSTDIGTIRLQLSTDKLQEVEVVSTGYQNIPKERATGSFAIIDNKTLNRAVSPDILSRLKGVTNGLFFGSSTDNPLGISVRGRSTLFSNTQPLIVLDNFPYEGDIEAINPNDIETVTILKDAAAASIWGTRAGNGVLVITTKKGIYNKPPAVSVNTNLTIADKPNLYYQDQLSSTDFIDLERFLFEKGKYNSTINNGYATISPVIAILQKQKLNQLTTEDAAAQIDRFRAYDIRDQIGQYYYRPRVSQQYHFNVTGGGAKQSYFLSGGYDHTLATIVGQSNSRFTLNGSNSYNVFKDKLTVSADLTFSSSKNQSAGSAYSPYLPYDQLADQQGNPLPVLSANGLRESFTDTVGNGRLLDWKSRPLEELRSKYKTTNHDETNYRLNLAAKYVVFKSLILSVNYQYLKANGLNESYSALESFSTRNLINSPSYVDEVTGKIVRPIPLGATLTTSNNSRMSNAGRAQLNFNEKFTDQHEVNAIAGYEVREDRSNFSSIPLYGYNPDRASFMTVDQTRNFDNLYGSGSTTVSKGTKSWALDRNISYYVNASYTYKSKYIASGSFRKDESNLFGVKANQKGVPLWSGGLLWNLHNEEFFNIKWLDILKLRASYGYNGNINKEITAYLTAAEQAYTNPYGQNLALIQNPPNDALRWERVRNINLGTDFQLKDNRISGSIELFIKEGMDLIGSSPIAAQSGLISFTGNVANTRTKGIDLLLNTINIRGNINWNSIFIYNYTRNTITNYQPYVGSNENVVSATGVNPIVNYPINALFAYKWAGLNDNGEPQGILNGEVSTDYTGIRNATDYNQLKFFGSSMPVHFGSLRNSFSYRFVELSFNMIYKLGYYQRRNSLDDFSLFNGVWQQPDFQKRWQTKGDELLTNVPAMNYPASSSRSGFYQKAAVLVERADHIRLQDIQLNFNLTKREIKGLPFPNINIYAYATNLPLLWTASKILHDPDVSSGSPDPFSIAFGFKANL
jgi:TonB-linked SusC/RagA family outer membrane protein